MNLNYYIKNNKLLVTLINRFEATTFPAITKHQTAKLIDRLIHTQMALVCYANVTYLPAIFFVL